MNRECLKEYMSKVSEKYPNLDFMYLLPKQSKFEKIFKKDITVNEFNRICDEILNVILQLELKRFPYTNYVADESYTHLSEIISRFNNVIMCTEINGDTFKYYPITIDEDTSKTLYCNVLKDIIKTYIETGEFIEFLIDKRIEEYNRSLENYMNVLKGINMKPYYGTPAYIIKHSKYILESAKKLSVDTNELEGLVRKLEDFNIVYPNVGSNYEKYPYFTEDYKIAYRNLEETYLQVLEIEKALMPINEQMWQAYLTNPNNHDDTNFKYLIHVFTGGFVPPDKMQKACSTLVTDSLLCIPYGTFGLIYDFNREAVETICTEDVGSWLVTKEDFLDRFLPTRMQLQHPEATSVFYEYEKNSKLVTPEEVEKVGINNNLKYNNNQPLTYDRSIYTEIFLNSKAKTCGVFYTDDCKNIQEVIEYAEKYNLPVVHLSLKKLRLINQRKQMVNTLLEQREKNNQFLVEEKIEESKKSGSKI